MKKMPTLTFLAPGPGPTGPRPRKKKIETYFFAQMDAKKNSAQTDERRQSYQTVYLPQSHRVTESQSDRVTESQSHATSTPYTGG